MSYEQALKQLGLKDGYTEEELKKAYRKLSVAFHPDLYIQNNMSQEEALKVMQSINEARDILKEALNNRQPQAKSTKEWKENTKQYKKPEEPKKSELAKEKEKLLAKLMYYMPKVSSEVYYKATADIEHYITCFRMSLDQINNVRDLDEKFVIYRNQIKHRLDKFKDSYCKRYNIDEEKLKIKIDTDQPIDELYANLESIRKQIEYHQKLRSTVNQITEKYKNYPAYENLKELVEQIKKQTKAKRILSDADLDTAINDMQNQIEKMFKSYYKVIEDSAKIQEYIAKNKVSDDFKKQSNELTYLIGIKDIDAAKATADSLIKEMQSKLRTQAEDEREAKIDVLYREAVEEITSRLKIFEMAKDSEKIKLTSSLLNQVVRLLDCVHKGKLPFSALDALKDLTYDDQAKDLVLVNGILNSAINENVYIEKNIENVMDALNIYYIKDIEGDKVYLHTSSIVTEQDDIVVPLAEFNSKYIPLYEALKDAKPRFIINANQEIALYSIDKRDVVINSDNQIGLNYTSYYQVGDMPLEYQQFKDKEYIISALNMQLINEDVLRRS